MKVLGVIQDAHVGFALKVLNRLAFVKGIELFSLDGQQIWKNLKDAASEAKLHKKEKLKLKSARQLLFELKNILECACANASAQNRPVLRRIVWW
jgi:hypothetical protein